MKELIKKLGLDENASWNEVKQLYFEQLKLWHPDRYNTDETMRKQGEERTKILNRAFHQLKSMVVHFEESGGTIDPDKPLVAQSKHVELPFFVDEEVLSESVLEKKRNYRQESMVGLKKVERRFGEPIEDSFGDIPQIRLLAGGAAAVIALVGTVAVIGMVDFNNTSKIKKSSAKNTQISREMPVAQIAAAKDASVENLPIDNLIQGSQGGERIITGIGNRKKDKVPAITLAASRCSKNGVKKQLSKGVGINTEDADGMTALSWAAKRNCGDLAKYLISKGASMKHISLNGFTPLAWAKWFKNIDVVKVLELDAANIKRHAARKRSRRSY